MLFLEVKTDFTEWCKRMFEYGFEQDKDFTPILGKSTGGRPSTDFALTLPTAKEISMLQRTEKGKEARKYFIACEEVAKSKSKPMNTLDFLQVTLDAMKVQDQRISSVENKMIEIEAKTTTRPEYYTIAGYAVVAGKRIGKNKAKELGRKASKICNEKGYETEKVHDDRYGYVKSYPVEVLKDVFSQLK